MPDGLEERIHPLGEMRFKGFAVQVIHLITSTPSSDPCQPTEAGSAKTQDFPFTGRRIPSQNSLRVHLGGQVHNLRRIGQFRRGTAFQISGLKHRF